MTAFNLILALTIRYGLTTKHTRPFCDSLTHCLFISKPSPWPMVRCRGSGFKTNQRVRPKTGFDSKRATPSGFGRSRGYGICIHHYWSLRLVDFAETLVEEAGSERKTTAFPLEKPADGQVSDPCMCVFACVCVEDVAYWVWTGWDTVETIAVFKQYTVYSWRQLVTCVSHL